MITKKCSFAPTCHDCCHGSCLLSERSTLPSAACTMWIMTPPPPSTRLLKTRCAPSGNGSEPGERNKCAAYSPKDSFLALKSEWTILFTDTTLMDTTYYKRSLVTRNLSDNLTQG